MLQDLLDSLREVLGFVLRRMRRSILMLLYLMLAFLPVFILYRSQLRRILDLLLVSEKFPVVFLGLFGAFMLSQVMLRYLRTDVDADERKHSYYELMDVSARLRKLEQAAGGLTSESREALVEAIKSDAASQMGVEFDKRLQDKYAPAMEIMTQAERVRSAANAMMSRLQTEIRALMKRGNLNLVLGTFTTGAAAALLAYIALTATLAAEDWHHYIPTYMLRLSMVVFIEVFAFFFLRLYRASLAEIKYFQNEITNLEAKCLALEFTILAGDKKAASKVVDQLSRTERNFVLKKNETTVELEKSRLDSQHVHEVVSTIRDFLPSGKHKELTRSLKQG